MRFVRLIGCSLLLGLISSSLMAQVKLSEKEQRKLVSKAQKKLEEFQALLNFISDETEVHDDVIQVINVRFSEPQNPNRMFYNGSVIIESDIEPTHFDHTNVEDQYAREYLRVLDLMYEKATEPTIEFSNIQVSKVFQKSYPYLLIKFDSRFGGANRELPLPYRTTQRIAEFRLELVGNKWEPYISSIRFYNPETPFKAKEYAGKPSTPNPSKEKAPKIPKVKTPKPTVAIRRKWPIPAGASILTIGGGIVYYVLRPQPRPGTEPE
ncbi:MAG: hypothetical protein AAF399_16685 [Bacteroidota bacterium]